MRRRTTAGDVWRVQGSKPVDVSEAGPFDEIVVGRRDGESWLHVEMMGDRSAFVRVGERCMWIYVPRRGVPQITHEETREWKPFRRCRKRPGGRRCILGVGHSGECYGGRGG